MYCSVKMKYSRDTLVIYLQVNRTKNSLKYGEFSLFFILKRNYLKAKYILKRQTLTFFLVMFLHMLNALNKIPV